MPKRYQRYREMKNNLKEIKEFINQWKVRAINYYHKAIEDYKKEYESISKRYYEEIITDEERRQERKELHEKYNDIVRDLAFGYSDKAREERLLKIINKEAEDKEIRLIQRVNKEVGGIVEAIDLYVGNNGDLNGYIKGENGTCKINTIYAGGYNIQILHYRVLVKKV